MVFSPAITGTNLLDLVQQFINNCGILWSHDFLNSKGATKGNFVLKTGAIFLEKSLLQGVKVRSYNQTFVI